WGSWYSGGWRRRTRTPGVAWASGRAGRPASAGWPVRPTWRPRWPTGRRTRPAAAGSGWRPPPCPTDRRRRGRAASRGPRRGAGGGRALPRLLPLGGAAFPEGPATDGVLGWVG